MASVYLAEDTQQGSEVALKIPHFVATSDEKGIKRFHREGRAAANIEHPHVCQVHDVGEHKGRLFMIMDYVEGCSLAEWLQQATDISVEQAVNITIKIARGIEAAHQNGVVHRDLKPANIMMTPASEPVITDFGMACWTDLQETVLTPTGAMVGTPGYMAPEQITGDKEKVGPASDIYSMGIILYELLTGWVPFSGNLATLLGSIVSDPPPRPTTYCEHLDPALETICLRALEKDPTARYATAGQFADALGDYLHGGQAELSDAVGQEKDADLTEEPASRPGLMAKLWTAVRRQT